MSNSRGKQIARLAQAVADVEAQQRDMQARAQTATPSPVKIVSGGIKSKADKLKIDGDAVRS